MNKKSIKKQIMKIGVILLIWVILASFLIINRTFADSDSLPVSIQTDKALYAVGDNVIVTVKLKEEVSTASYYLNYNSSALTYVGKNTTGLSAKNYPEDGLVRAVYYDGDGVGTKEMAFTFKLTKVDDLGLSLTNTTMVTAKDSKSHTQNQITMVNNIDGNSTNTVDLTNVLNNTNSVLINETNATNSANTIDLTNTFNDTNNQANITNSANVANVVTNSTIDNTGNNNIDLNDLNSILNALENTNNINKDNTVGNNTVGDNTSNKNNNAITGTQKENSINNAIKNSSNGSNGSNVQNNSKINAIQNNVNGKDVTTSNSSLPKTGERNIFTYIIIGFIFISIYLGYNVVKLGSYFKF